MHSSLKKTFNIWKLNFVYTSVSSAFTAGNVFCMILLIKVLECEVLLDLSRFVLYLILKTREKNHKGGPERPV